MKLREESGAYGKKLVFYEDMLSADSDYALREGSMHFEENSKVHKAMHKIADRLGALCVPFAFVGGMARGALARCS